MLSLLLLISSCEQPIVCTEITGPSVIWPARTFTYRYAPDIDVALLRKAANDLNDVGGFTLVDGGEGVSSGTCTPGEVYVRFSELGASGQRAITSVVSDTRAGVILAGSISLDANAFKQGTQSGPKNAEQLRHRTYNTFLLQLAQAMGLNRDPDVDAECAADSIFFRDDIDDEDWKLSAQDRAGYHFIYPVTGDVQRCVPVTSEEPARTCEQLVEDARRANTGDVGPTCNGGGAGMLAALVVLLSLLRRR